MKNFFYLFLGISCFLMNGFSNAEQTLDTDIVIIGGGSGGTAAAVQAARLGSKVVLVESTPWLGGMATSAGVSCMDGNNGAQNTGFFKEFRTKIENYYGGAANVAINWVSNCSFEPHVGNQIFHEIVNAESNITLFHEAEVLEVLKSDKKILGVVIQDKNKNRITVNAKITIDATEFGDIMDMAGIPYTFGRESRAQTGESPAPNKADDVIQDPTYTIIIKRYTGEDRTWANPPEGYNPALFDCCCTGSCTDGSAKWTCDMMLSYGKLQNNKYMINWPLKGNDYYIPLYNLTKEQREEAFKEAKKHSLNFIYFHQTVLGWTDLDIANDEFPTTDSLPFFPYIRESRRVNGISQFRLQDITNRYTTQSGDVYKTTIAVGDYFVDHHHAAYNKPAYYTGENYPEIPKIGVPLFVFIPKDTEGFMAAEKSISVSHIVNGCTRLQPVVMLIGQAAGAAASISCKNNIQPKDLSVREVQQALLDAGSTCFPMEDMVPYRWSFKNVQRVCLAGVLKVEDSGRSTKFNPAVNITLKKTAEAFAIALNQADFTSPSVDLNSDNNLTRSQLAQIIYEAAAYTPPSSTTPYYNDVAGTHQFFNAIQVFHEKGIDAGWAVPPNFEPDKLVTREEFAVAIDRSLNPFVKNPVQIVPPPIVTPTPVPLKKANPIWKLHHDTSAEGRTGAAPAWIPTVTESNRDMALNIKTGHLLIPNLTEKKIYIASSTDGSYIGELDNTLISNAVLSIASIVADSNGIIYAANYDTTNFKIYRWASESSPCSIAYQGPLTQSGGRAMDILSSGTLTQLYVSRASTSGGFYRFKTSDGQQFTLESTASSSGYSDYGTYGIAVENEKSVLLKPVGSAIKRMIYNDVAGTWQEDAVFTAEEFNNAINSKLKFTPDRKFIASLATDTFGPYTIDGAPVSGTGFLIYDYNNGKIGKLRVCGILEELNSVGNYSGGISFDEKYSKCYVLFPKNGYAAYNLQGIINSTDIWLSH